MKLTDGNRITDQASSQIREVISNAYPATSFLVGLLTGNPQNLNPSERVSNLIHSFGQGLIYAVTYGQHKPPKHVLLPYAVKTLTGNTEIIKISRKTTPLSVYKSWHQVWMKKCHFPPPLSHKSSQTSPGTT